MPQPILTLDELTTPLTRAEVQASIYNVLARVGVSVTSWKRGAPTRTVIVAVSSVVAAMSTHLAAIARGGFLELAEGGWLDLVAYYVYGVTRTQAQFATGTVTLTNGGGGIYALDAGDLIVTNPTTQASYRNSAPLNLTASGTVTVPIIAVEAGSGATSDAGTVTSLTTRLPGVDCVNDERVVGIDAETDEQLRAHCTERLGALSPMGPWDAYSFAARNATRASDGSSVGVTRVRLTKDGYGRVFLYVAKQGGGVPSADIARVADAVEQLAVPQAITATVYSASTKPLVVDYTAYAYSTSGRTPDDIAELIRARLAAFVDAQPVGGHVVGSAKGRVYADAIRSAIASALPEIFHVELVGGDVELETDEVPTLGVPVPSVILVAPSEGYGG